MKAARYYGKEDVRVEDVLIPEPGPNECLIEVEWAGICGTDLHEYLAGTPSFIAQTQHERTALIHASSRSHRNSNTRSSTSPDRRFDTNHAGS
jgi:threonine dehydrogenase-like Zn-dependent dehydrogenase